MKPQREIGYAEFHWRMVGAACLANKRSLQTALEAAPRSTERDWIQAGYDEYMAEHPDAAANDPIYEVNA